MIYKIFKVIKAEWNKEQNATGLSFHTAQKQIFNFSISNAKNCGILFATDANLEIKDLQNIEIYKIDKSNFILPFIEKILKRKAFEDAKLEARTIYSSKGLIQIVFYNQSSKTKAVIKYPILQSGDLAEVERYLTIKEYEWAQLKGF